jgi:hypothetical protein
MMMNMLFAIIVVHLATNIIAKKGKKQRWWTCYNAHHCPTHQDAQEKKLEKNIISLYIVVCSSSNKQ